MLDVQTLQLQISMLYQLKQEKPVNMDFGLTNEVFLLTWI